jgi:hypothetical protein
VVQAVERSGAGAHPLVPMVVKMVVPHVEIMHLIQESVVLDANIIQLQESVQQQQQQQLLHQLFHHLHHVLQNLGVHVKDIILLHVVALVLFLVNVLELFIMFTTEMVKQMIALLVHTAGVLMSLTAQSIVQLARLVGFAQIQTHQYATELSVKDIRVTTHTLVILIMNATVLYQRNVTLMTVLLISNAMKESLSTSI